MPYQLPRIPIGKRRERVTIREAVTVDDGLGGQVAVRPRVIAEPWAKVEALDERSQEAIGGLQIIARHGYQVTIPYRTDITTRQVMNVRGTTMEIHTVADDEGLRRRLVLQVREIQ